MIYFAANNPWCGIRIKIAGKILYLYLFSGIPIIITDPNLPILRKQIIIENHNMSAILSLIDQRSALWLRHPADLSVILRKAGQFKIRKR